MAGPVGIDLIAASKAFIVTLVSLCFLAQYCALLQACNNGVYPYGAHDSELQVWSDVELQDCRVPIVDVAMFTTNEKSTWAMAYACVYSIVSCLSFLGCAMIICKADGFAKLYAVGLVLSMGVITLFDYWVVAALHHVGSKMLIDSDVVNYQAAKIITVWFMQLAIYLNTAADAWSTSKENQVRLDNTGQ